MANARGLWALPALDCADEVAPICKRTSKRTAIRPLLQLQDDAQLDSFVQTHIPFADDGCGNDIWIEVSTGIIKAFYHEYSLEEGLIVVAPSFDVFCSSLENWVLNNNT